MLAPGGAVACKPLGDGFVRLIRMLIAPVIFCTVVTGIAGTRRMREVGRAGGLAILYFEVVSTLALLVGLAVVNALKPGAAFHADPGSLDAGAVAAYAQAGQKLDVGHGGAAFVLSLIPESFLGALASGDILQTLLLAVLSGLALHACGGREHRLYGFFTSAGELLFAAVGLVMRLAPIGAFGAMAFTVGRYGLKALAPLAQLIGCFYLTCVAFVLLVLGAIARLHGFSILRFLHFIRAELLLVLGTSSSESALPGLMARLEELGAEPAVVGLVVPAGYSFNLDGTAIYLSLAAVFVAQATGTALDAGQQLLLLGVLMLTSKGAAGVTGSGFIVLAATLPVVGHVPVAGLGLILGIDRFMSEARALTNIVGNGVATLVVARWCGALDGKRLQAGLGGGVVGSRSVLGS